jgi:hypothetical protein
VLAAIFLALFAAPFAIGRSAHAHGAEIEVVVESLQNPDGSFGYAVVLMFADGDTISGADVALAATGPSSQRLTAAAVETGDGIYIAELSLARDRVWRIEVDIMSDGGNGSVAFDEIVPAPVDAGVPIVRIDTISPDRIGVPVGADSAILGGGPTEPSLIRDVDYDLRVEALVESDVVPLSIVSGVQIGITDASVVDGVTVEATSDDVTN